MRILVTFAVDAEFSPWRKLRQFVKQSTRSAEFFTSRVGDANLNVLLTGVGGKSAWLEATKVIWDGEVDFCVSSGLAGALRSEYRIGDVLAAKEVHAISWKRTVISDAALIHLAQQQGARVVDSFYTSERIVALASEKRELGKLADAVEMESGEILHEVGGFGAKGIAIRGISDIADEDLPLDFNKLLTPTGDVSIPKVVREVVRHPLSTSAFIRFGSQSRMAAEALCAFLDRYVEAVVSAMTTAMGATT